MNKKQIKVGFSPHDKSLIESVARSRGISSSRLIREIVLHTVSFFRSDGCVD